MIKATFNITSQQQNYMQLRYLKEGMKMIILGIIVTIVIGLIGANIGYGMNAAELGPILSIATMGGFIMAYIKRNNIK